MSVIVRFNNEDLRGFINFISAIPDIEINEMIGDGATVCLFRLPSDVNSTQIDNGNAANQGFTGQKFARVFGPSCHLIHDFYKMKNAKEGV